MSRIPAAPSFRQTGQSPSQSAHSSEASRSGSSSGDHSSLNRGASADMDIDSGGSDQRTTGCLAPREAGLAAVRRSENRVANTARPRSTRQVPARNANSPSSAASLPCYDNIHQRRSSTHLRQGSSDLVADLGLGLLNLDIGDRPSGRPDKAIMDKIISNFLQGYSDPLLCSSILGATVRKLTEYQDELGDKRFEKQIAAVKDWMNDQKIGC
jgi:hypothetical protein